MGFFEEKTQSPYEDCRIFLLTNKYQSPEDAKEILGDVANISKPFIEFQQYLYAQEVA